MIILERGCGSFDDRYGEHKGVGFVAIFNIVAMQGVFSWNKQRYLTEWTGVFIMPGAIIWFFLACFCQRWICYCTGMHCPSSRIDSMLKYDNFVKPGSKLKLCSHNSAWYTGYNGITSCNIPKYWESELTSSEQNLTDSTLIYSIKMFCSKGECALRQKYLRSLHKTNTIEFTTVSDMKRENCHLSSTSNTEIALYGYIISYPAEGRC